MCGLAGFVLRESVPDWEVFDSLFTWAQNRGTDGFGVSVISRDKDIRTFNTLDPYTDKRDDVRKWLDACELKIGDVLLAICRAAPEQEPPSSEINCQPIVSSERHGCVLVHNGSISQVVYDELRENADYDWICEIDSEAIIASYVHHQRNIRKTMEFISGGVAAMLYDKHKHCLYLITDYKPLAHAYVRGVGYFIASDNDALNTVIQSQTGCTRDGINVWEDWYHHYIEGQMIIDMDLDSGFCKKIPYSPRFITQRWDSNNPKHVPEDKDICLVSCSGGFDSSMTLALLKMSGFKNVIACHFKYGHRGQNAEEYAIRNVCKELELPLKVFDIESLVRSIDSTSMLTDKNAKITTGTREGLKKLDAWVSGRNMFFLTAMAAYAEQLVMNEEFENVYMLGGFLNLTESGHYPDNSEYFVSSFLEYVKYATLIGSRVKPLYGLSNLMKSDQFYLAQQFGLQDVYKHTISCDRPRVYSTFGGDNSICEPQNCSKDGKPACGSGLLSYWASQMVGINDMDIRQFYEVDDPDYVAHEPAHMNTGVILKKDIHSIIDRILFPKDKLAQLHKLAEK